LSKAYFKGFSSSGFFLGAFGLGIPYFEGLPIGFSFCYFTGALLFFSNYEAFYDKFPNPEP